MGTQVWPWNCANIRQLLETEITELTVGTTSHDPMALILTALVLVLRDHLGAGAQ